MKMPTSAPRPSSRRYEKERSESLRIALRRNTHSRGPHSYLRTGARQWNFEILRPDRHGILKERGVSICFGCPHRRRHRSRFDSGRGITSGEGPSSSAMPSSRQKHQRIVVIIPPAFRASFHKLTLLGKPGFFHHFLKARIVAQRVEPRIEF